MKYCNRDSTIWKIWFVETKMNCFTLPQSIMLGGNPPPRPHGESWYGSIMLWRCYSSAGTRNLGRLNRWIEQSTGQSDKKHFSRLKENWHWSRASPANETTTLSQPTAQATTEWLKTDNRNVSQWLNRNPVLNPTENLRRPVSAMSA